MLKQFYIYLTVLFFLSGTTSLFAQDDLKMIDYVYKPNIASVQLFRSGYPASFPAIELGGLDTLELHFDDLDGGSKVYSYAFVYCDRNWEPSNSAAIFSIGGVMQRDLTVMDFSFGTKEVYTHYSLRFPDAEMYPKISGNYILKVFEGYDPENLVLSRRFMVYENVVQVQGKIRDAMNADYRLTGQEVIFDIDVAKLTNVVPFRDITVMMMQNSRWDNLKTDLKPVFVNGTAMDYKLIDNSNMFPGGNEYRFLDIRTIRTRAAKTQFMETGKDGFVYNSMFPERSRRNTQYTNLPDLNGGFFIQNIDGITGNTDADYTYVRFALSYDQGTSGLGDVYILGQMTGNRLNPDWKMDYDYERKEYFLQKFLKQGYYNYLFIRKDPTNGSSDTEFFEGSFARTENVYYVFVYFRDPLSQRNDRLVGFGVFNSFRDR